MNNKHLTVVAILQAKSDQIDALRQELLALLPITRQEDGCLGYDLHQDIEQPARFIFYEQWRSKTHLDTHLNRPHIQAFVAKTPHLLAEPLQIILCEKIG